MRGRYQLVEDDDPYGPGADLVLSLFAMAILLVGLIGTGDAVQRATAATTSSSPTTAVVINGATPDPQISNLTRTIASLDQELKRKDERIQEAETVVEQLKAALRNREPARIELTDVNAEAGPLFKTCAGDALAQYVCMLQPTPRLIAALLEGLRAKAADMKAVKANQIVVEVRGLAAALESPVSRQREGQLDLSVDRAAGIAHMLAARGLPYVCIVPIGMGRTRSSAMRGQINRGQEALDSWDRLVRDPANAKALVHSGDLRVIAYSRNDDMDDACPSDSLSRALARIRD